MIMKQVLEMTSQVIYAPSGPSLKWSNIRHKREFVISYVRGRIRYTINSICLYTSFVLKHGDLKQLGQVTSVAKQSDPVTQFNSYENVDWEMQLPTYLPKLGGCHLAAATSLAWGGEDHLLTTLAAHLLENGDSALMSSLLDYKWPDDTVTDWIRSFREIPSAALRCSHLRNDWLSNISLFEFFNSKWAQKMSLNFWHPIAGHFYIWKAWV
jgi:hypothetical protein